MSGPHSGSGTCRQHWARGSSGRQNPPGVTQSHPLQGCQHSSFTHTPSGFTGVPKALKMGTDGTHRAERMQAGVGLPQTGEGLLDIGQPCPERGRVLLKRQVQRPWGRSFSRLAEEESTAEAGGGWVGDLESCAEQSAFCLCLTGRQKAPRPVIHTEYWAGGPAGTEKRNSFHNA